MLAVSVAVIVVGILMRQIDRWHFSPMRGGHTPRTRRELTVMQRARANDVTPVFLMAGHWVEVAGWWLLATRLGALGWVIAATAIAVKMRHLQEVSHHAVHGVLTRDRAVGAMLAELAAHAPLGMVPVQVRWKRHVQRHHPNATVVGVDPNLDDLHRAGLRPGVSRRRFLLGVLFPLSPAGIGRTAVAIAEGVRGQAEMGWWRVAVFLAVPASAVAFGWPLLIFGWVVPRLLLYPLLAWMSMLAEHRWFDPGVDAGRTPYRTRSEVIEALRCLRLYRRNRVLEFVARGTWLPYGDLFHYAHSAHPAVRWNYLPALEATLSTRCRSSRGLLVGSGAVLSWHFRALRGGPGPCSPDGPVRALDVA